MKRSQVSILVILVAIAPLLNPQLFLFCHDSVWRLLCYLDESQAEFDRNPFFNVAHLKPISQQGTHYNLHILKGEIPPEADGVFIHIGPNPAFYSVIDNKTYNLERAFNTGKYHWFEGDGMIYVVNLFSNNSAHFTNSWVKTHKHELETKYNQLIYKAQFSDVLENGWIGILKALWSSLLTDFAMSPFKQKLIETGTSNTAIIHWNGQFFALVENTLPFEFSISETDSSILQYGYNSINEKWQTSFGAHPKIDPFTNEMIAFGDMFSPLDKTLGDGIAHVNIGIFQANETHSVVREKQEKQKQSNKKLDGLKSNNINDMALASIPLNNEQMMHDIMVSKNYVIIPDLNLWSGENFLFQNKSFFVFNNDVNARFGFVRRDKMLENHKLGQKMNVYDDNNVKWIDIDPCFMFHMAAVWEEVDSSNNHEIVKLIGARSDKHDMLFFQAPHRIVEEKKEPLEWNNPYAYEWVFDLTDGKILSHGKIKSLQDKVVEFPITHPMKRGGSGQMPNTIFWELIDATGHDKIIPGFRFVGIVKHMVSNGEIKTIKFSENSSRVACGEAVFMPSDETGKRDGDGYLGVFIYDYETDGMTFEIFDATNMNSDPVAVIELPHRIPQGFHSIFVPRRDFVKRQRK